MKTNVKLNTRGPTKILGRTQQNYTAAIRRGTALANKHCKKIYMDFIVGRGWTFYTGAQPRDAIYYGESIAASFEPTKCRSSR